jgi:hypothetical protein
MRITKRQLRRIIREEKRTLMNESRQAAEEKRPLLKSRSLLREGQSQEEALFAALDQYVMVLDEEMGYDVPRDQLKAEVLNFVDGFFEATEFAAKMDAEDVYEGTSPDNMPSSWKQILKGTLG